MQKKRRGKSVSEEQTPSLSYIFYLLPFLFVGKCIYNGHVKIYLSCSGIMTQFCHELAIQSHIQSYLNRYIYAQRTPDQVKTCCGGPRMVQYGC